MAKSFLSILLTTLLLGANIALSQEKNSAGFQILIPINQGYTDSFAAVSAVGEQKLVALQELSSEELDQIIGEGFGDLLATNNDQVNSVPWIILWDDIAKQRNGSAVDVITLTSCGSFMNGIQISGIDK